MANNKLSPNMMKWEKLLKQIAKAGYSYGYTSFIDIFTGQEFFLVDAIKGEGPRTAVAKPTMLQAVQELMGLLSIKNEEDK